MQSKIFFYIFLAILVFSASVTLYKYIVLHDFDVTASPEEIVE